MQIKTKIVSCHTADSKPVKPEVNGTVILPPLVFPGLNRSNSWARGIGSMLDEVGKAASLARGEEGWVKVRLG